MRQPWADGPRTQQCDGLAFSQVTGTRWRWEWQAVNPARAERGREGCPWLVLGWPFPCCHGAVAAGSFCPDVPHALSRVTEEENDGWLRGRSEHGAMTYVCGEASGPPGATADEVGLFDN